MLKRIASVFSVICLVVFLFGCATTKQGEIKKEEMGSEEHHEISNMVQGVNTQQPHGYDAVSGKDISPGRR